MTTFNRYVSPWLELIDDAKYQKTVDRSSSSAPRSIAGCHTPVIAARTSPPRSRPPAARRGDDVRPEPDQEVLDQIQLAMIAAQ